MASGASAQWSLDDAPIMPGKPDARHVSFTTRSRHLLVDSRHRRPQDTAEDYRVFFGVREEQGATVGETIRNAVSVNVVSAEIPRTADNIIEGRNTLSVNILGSTRTLRVPRGLYYYI